MKTLIFVGGTYEQSKFYQREFMADHEIKHKIKWERLRAPNQFVTSDKALRVMLMQPPFDNLRGLKNYEIVKCGRWYEHKDRDLDELEYYAVRAQNFNLS